jgi:adenylate kinase family enzyme
LWGRNYHHFDFGHHLRNIADGRIKIDFSDDEIKTIDNVLKSNALLEDTHFPIAEKIYQNFIATLGEEVDPLLDVVILNGLPRRIGQAMEMEKLLDIKIVIYFAATANIILNRIKSNVGGDRTGRTDDSIEEITRKLDIFYEQTTPLLDFYKSLNKTILQIDVDEETIPLYVIQGLQTMPCLL